ncbi:LOW QUALITY PROTEIN: histone-lysine N-methyltransferase SETDB1-like [Hyalella azteca]|uniref:LOW QUALITY PROTEIN: histone-lysine N-methyltransferase SETDB1-like n=1 Tax=Hyalella azteca TaxID=294128 RepID=A0A8B7NRN6_HYAAZ|nr:LOW QUALITY PROTEIN: histone-lysine N-methyltransferase SETDB1-like [Hyalella azteca]
MAEIINLSDDDDVVCEQRITNPLAAADPPKLARCLNSECHSREGLRKAPAAARRFYGVLAYPKKTRICLPCLACFSLHQQKLIEKVRNGENIILINNEPQRDTVLLTDSESDPDDVESEESVLELSLSGSDSDKDSGDAEQPDRLKRMLENMVDSLALKKHVDEGIENVTSRIAKAENGLKEMDEEYNKIEKELHSIRCSFYDSFKPKIKLLPEVDVDNNPGLDDQVHVVPSEHVTCQASLPPVAPLMRPQLVPGQAVYAMRLSLFSRWVPAVVVSVVHKEENNTRYMVRYNRFQAEMKELTGRQLAYEYQCATRLVVGTRVIARFRDEEKNGRKDDQKNGRHDTSSTNGFYVGIVAEVPTVANKFKYLIFFDDGYAQYVLHHHIRVVTEASAQAWDDVCSDSRAFIKEYVQMYPERPMVRLQKWNNVKTERNGKWWRAQVLEVEGSLVKMYFPTHELSEWIYRGSTRLSPLFQKKMSLQANAEQHSRLTVRRRAMIPGRQAGPVVEYCTFGQESILPTPLGSSTVTPREKFTPQSVTAAISHPPPPLLLNASFPSSLISTPSGNSSRVSLPTPIVSSTATSTSAPAASAPSATAPTGNRSVAKKSTGARPGTPPPELLEKIKQEMNGFIKKAQIPPLERRFRPHQCGSACVGGPKGEELLKKNRYISPLLIPIVLGWRRQLVRQRKKTILRRSVYYVTPCCRRLRNIDELFVYLRTTHSKLEIDYFSFELNIDVINEWAPSKELYTIPDFSQGVEPMPIHCVNSLDSDPPFPLEYCNVRMPAPGVPLNLDTDFLVCCSCTDDCQDKSRCECWQLTLESNKRLPPKLQLNDPGYVHRRLYEQVTSGIFECNSRCACKHTCQNRVVQNPLRIKLQLFKTARRGWGVRTLHEMEDMKEGYEDEVDHDEDDFPDRQKKKKSSDEDDSEPEGSDGELRYQRNDKHDDNFVPSCPTQRSNNVTERLPSSRLLAISARKKNTDSGGDEDDPDDPAPVASPESSRAASPSSLSRRPSEDDDDDADGRQRRRQNFSAVIPDNLPTSPTKQSHRQYYGEDEQVYVIDAKRAGNIGRFLNHSCQPNVFVQNVFVDSQDLRFPYMSFFATCSIRAGCELTWDYNYEVGCVQGKVKYCYCGAKKCRGRLL